MAHATTQPKNEPSRQHVWHMFDRIAHRYDLLNRLLSMRQDVAWRNKMATLLPERPNLRLLDLATGTADQILSLIHKSDRIGSAVGIDMSTEMLSFGREKIAKRGLSERVVLQEGDAMQPPLPDNSFDVVTISFGIRNVLDVTQSLREMQRVLKPGGRVLILEFSLPSNWLMRKSYLFYFRNILPWIGGKISGDSYAYRYLNQTVESFPYGRTFCRLLEEAGFENVTDHPLTFGIASIYQGDKPENRTTP